MRAVRCREGKVELVQLPQPQGAIEARPRRDDIGRSLPAPAAPD